MTDPEQEAKDELAGGERMERGVEWGLVLTIGILLIAAAVWLIWWIKK